MKYFDLAPIRRINFDDLSASKFTAISVFEQREIMSSVCWSGVKYQQTAEVHSLNLSKTYCYLGGGTLYVESTDKCCPYKWIFGPNIL